MSDSGGESDRCYQEAVGRVRAALERARAAAVAEPTAATLATVGHDGWPAARTVLLKGLDASGAVFYTNRRSRKGQHLAENPRASLCLFWAPLGEQVELRGVTVAVSAAEADTYWAQRPRLSQLGAWASQQSQPLGSREELEERVARLERQYPGEIPRPPHWSGYRLVPSSIELWSAGDGRLHERERYELRPEGWTWLRLNP